MKKSLIAFAALATIAGAASAQSSVTLYGRVDLSVGKNAGSANKVMQNGSGSRLGVRGVEDLGGGMSAFFNIEHRFDADTGNQPNARFWHARSILGLQGGFGKVTLGREYTTAFLGSQLQNDPWGWDTVAAGTGTAGVTGLGIAAVRNDSSLTYNFSAGGFSLGAQIAEATDAIANLEKKPVNFSLGYAAGPVAVNFGYEKTGAVTSGHAAKVMTLGGSFNVGAVKLGASYGKGTVGTSTFKNALGTAVAAGADAKSYMLTAAAPMGQGEFRAAYGKRKIAGTTDISLVALGYHYALSKRTTIYADFARNGELASQATAYDFGIKHNF